MKARRTLVVALAVLVSFLWTQADAQPPDVCQGEPITDNRATDDDDFLTGTGGGDVIALGTGNDQYFAAEGADGPICGGEGADVVVGEGQADRLFGGIGADIVSGLVGGDTVQGGLGPDKVDGGPGDDIIRAGDDEAQDELFDGPGSDVIIGGPEDTWYRCDDGDVDTHEAFNGQTLPDPACP